MKPFIQVTAIAALSLLFTGAHAAASGPSAKELVQEINAIQIPKLDRTKIQDRDYVKKYQEDTIKAYSDRNKLILELYQDHPDDPELPALLEKRWQTLFIGHRVTADDFEAAIKETGDVVGSNVPLSLKQTAFYYQTEFKMDSEKSIDEKHTDAELFIQTYPKDDRGSRLLTELVYATDNPIEQGKIDQEIVDKFPNSRDAGFAKGGVRKAAGIGKPFELSFNDAISGKHVSVSDLRGKVVVIDFWATWCGPCKAEMPHMKELYAKYHDQGVEYIGVSLDLPKAKGGLTSLQKYVADNQMPWAQYYQGNYWDSKFSTSWGVNSIPCVFIVDKSGNLSDVQGGEDTESKIKKLLGG